MTIKTPVRITYEANTRGFASYPHFVDADGYHVEFSALAAALNATADAPDLTATVNRILNTLHHQGLTTWGCLSIEDAEACRAEAYAAVMDILKDGTP